MRVQVKGCEFFMGGAVRHIMVVKGHDEGIDVNEGNEGDLERASHTPLRPARSGLREG